MLRLANLAVALVVTACIPAAARTIRYEIDVTPSADTGAPAFSFAFEMADYITTTGLFPLPASVAVPGYNLIVGGTNSGGDWVFGISGVGINDLFPTAITVPGEWNMVLAGSSRGGFITAPGVVSFSTAAAFVGVPSPDDIYLGTALLRVTDSSVTEVPEPSSFALLAIGAAALIPAFQQRGRTSQRGLNYT